MVSPTIWIQHPCFKYRDDFFENLIKHISFDNFNIVIQQDIAHDRIKLILVLY